MLKIIAAIDKNRGLGRNNKLLYSYREDMEMFKKLTWGYPVIMGRKTFESIGKPLPGRENIVLSSRETDFSDVRVFGSRQEVLEYLGNRDAFVIGGASVYRLFWDRVQELYLTEISLSDPEADSFFPEFSTEEFREVSCLKSNRGNPCLFKKYRRQAP